ncbi:MAG: heparinase II/III family protein [Parachlamydiales bacterium]|nr:heparinase II/III family protein [Parachlamydiales bacterium]
MNCKGIGGYQFPPSTKVQMKGPNLPLANEILACLSQGYIPIDWHIDFKSGFRWNENVSSLDIQYGDRQGADVKVPWELARMQHLTMLAFGYALTSDKKYCFEFQNQVLDFIGSNPPRYGVNWVCTMDVGIRIANWLFAYDLFKAYNASFEKDFEEIFFRSVYEHGKHIRSHLEWDPYLRSNHYLANIAGLLFAAAYLPQKEWLEFSVRELEAEVLSQFHPDGTNFEASTSYHRLSAEMAVYSAGLALQLGVEFSREFIDRIQKMADFTRDITKPDGTIVQFGDNDSGRFIKLLPDVSELDHRYLIRAIRGMKNLNSVVASQFTQVQETPQQVSAYIDFGLYMQRNGPWFFAFRCGNIGQKGNGGHAHNDQLSFELAVNGVSMIIDPGTYVYTPLPDERRRFRSTAMHNTVAVVGMEQNEDKGLFQMKDRSQGKMICFEEGLFIGQHEGLGKPVKRTIKIFHDRIEGLDAYEGMKEIYFHFASGWVVELVSENRALLSFGNLHAQFLSESGRCRLVQSTVSSGYGKIERAQVVVLEAGCEPASWMIFL